MLLRSCLHGVCVSGELVEWGVDESEMSGGSSMECLMSRASSDVE